METIKNIAAILGVILSASAVITLFCNPVKSFLVKYLEKYKKEEVTKQKNESIKSTLLRLEKKIDAIKRDNDITVDFTREQIRGIVKDMFFKYYDVKTLPLYEHKWLLKLEDLYIVRLKSNSFIKELIDEMKQWPVDYSHIRDGEVD